VKRPTATVAICLVLATLLLSSCAAKSASPNGASPTWIHPIASSISKGDQQVIDQAKQSADTRTLTRLTATVDPSISDSVTLDSGAITMAWAGDVPRPKISPQQAYKIGKRELASPDHPTYCRFGRLTVRDIIGDSGRLYDGTLAWMCFAIGVGYAPSGGVDSHGKALAKPEGTATVETFLDATTGKIFFTQMNGQ
jgi:hypothetical protein